MLWKNIIAGIPILHFTPHFRIVCRRLGDRVHLYIPGMRGGTGIYILNSIRDKVSGQESGGGSFQAGSASGGK